MTDEAKEVAVLWDQGESKWMATGYCLLRWAETIDALVEIIETKTMELHGRDVKVNVTIHLEPDYD